MKLTLLILIFVSIGCRISRNQPSFENYRNKEYKVEKIDSVNNYYLIYFIQDNKNFKTVSKKRLINSTPCLNKIEVGQKYLFKLQKLIRTPIKDSNPLANKPSLTILSCYYFDETTKICEEEGMEVLYITDDLDGMCIKK